MNEVRVSIGIVTTGAEAGDCELVADIGGDHIPATDDIFMVIQQT